MASRAEGFGPEVKRRIMLGTFALSAGYADQYYNQALKVRRLIRNDFDAAFKEVDVLLGPTTPTAAFKLGEKTADPLAMYLSDIYTITTNLAGIPGLSIPCGLTKSGLPIGLQLLAPAFAEETLLRTARVFEKATDWHTKRPDLRSGLEDRRRSRSNHGTLSWALERAHGLHDHHRPRSPRPAHDREQDVLGVRDRVRPAAEHADRPGLARDAGDAAGHERQGVRAGAEDGRGAPRRDRPLHQVGPEELLLSRPAQELSDQPV